MMYNLEYRCKCQQYVMVIIAKYKKMLMFLYHTALLWQKEASDIPSKSELFMFSYFIECALLPGRILCINTHPAKRNVSYDIMIFH